MHQIGHLPRVIPGCTVSKTNKKFNLRLISNCSLPRFLMVLANVTHCAKVNHISLRRRKVVYGTYLSKYRGSLKHHGSWYLFLVVVLWLSQTPLRMFRRLGFLLLQWHKHTSCNTKYYRARLDACLTRDWAGDGINEDMYCFLPSCDTMQ